ncbi:unnamed protein product [Aphis gossypii]|uniref:Uncharacterized protein n=1 Tax=Aphis gossypii TaxID=80765 RepID=A0A9P0JEB6_APHGO|nr:unnamed protein product [Aphis gossypii]
MYTVYRANAYIDFRTKLVWFLNPLHSSACTYYNDNIYFYLRTRKRRKPTCRHISTDYASAVTLYNDIAQNTPVITMILCFNITYYYYLLYRYVHRGTLTNSLPKVTFLSSCHFSSISPQTAVFPYQNI